MLFVGGGLSERVVKIIMFCRFEDENASCE